MDLIIQELKYCTSGTESTRLHMETDCDTGESQFVIEKSVREYFPVTDKKKVKKIYKEITGGGGRPVITLNHFRPK